MKKDQKYFMRRCRLCGRCHKGSLDIISSKDRNLKELIHQYLHINIREDDALPKKLCQFCDKKLSIWEKFKNSCENMQVKLIADSLPKKVDIPKNKLRGKSCDGPECMSQISTKNAAGKRLLEAINSKQMSRSPFHRTATFQNIDNNCQSDINILEPKVVNVTEECSFKDNLLPREQSHFNALFETYVGEISMNKSSAIFSSKSEENCDVSDEKSKSQKSPIIVSQFSDQDINDLNDTLSKNISSDGSLCPKVEASDNAEVCLTYQESKNFNLTNRPLKNRRNRVVDTEKSAAKEYRCVVCNESFSSLRKMKIHVKEHSAQKDEKKNTARRSPKKELQCPHCPRKLSTNFNLRHHLDTHSETCNYCCHLCGKLFRTRSSLSNHVRVHLCDEMKDQTKTTGSLDNGSSVRLFQCEICDKKFRQSGHLAYHLKMHTGLRIYNCNECGLRFTEKYQLRKHENAVHNHVKRYTCDVCGKQFLHTHNFRDHKLQHEGIANVSCDLCGKTFVTSNALSRHQRLHSGVKPFACDICGKKFRDCSNRKRHRDKHMEEEKKSLSADKPKEGQNSNVLTIVEEIVESPDYEKEEVEGKVKKTYMNLKTYFESNDDVSMRVEAKGGEKIVASSENPELLQPLSNIGNPDESSNPGLLLGCGLFGEEMDLNSENLLLIGDGRVNNSMTELQGLKDQLVWVSSSDATPVGDECLNGVCSEDGTLHGGDVALGGGEVGIPGIQMGLSGMQGGDITGILEVGMGLCGDFDVGAGIDLDSAKDGLSDDFSSISEIKEVEENEKAFDNVLCLQVF